MVPVSLLFVLPLLFALIVAEVVSDRVHKKKLFGMHDSITNLSLAMGNHATNLVLNIVLFAIYLYCFDTIAIWHIEPSILSFFACLMLFDFLYYANHRLGHQINFLWAIHVVHHSSEEYNLTVALRRSWFVNLIGIFFLLPIPMLGFDMKMFLAITTFHSVWGYLQHTKLIKKFPKIIEYAFVTPSHHRVHHGVNPQYIDKNYSGMFIMWDRLLGTFEPEVEEPIFGITTPVKSWDPIWAQFHFWYYLVYYAKKSKRWQDKIKIFFARPGWLPKELGGFQPPRVFTKENFKKYDVKVPKALNRYVIFHVVLGAISALTVTFYSIINFPPLYVVLFFLAIAAASIFPAAMLERRRWSGIAEVTRLIFTYLVISVFAWQSLEFNSGIFAVVLNTLVLISILVWFNHVWKLRFSVEKEEMTSELKISMPE